MNKDLLTFMVFLKEGVSLLPQDISAKTYIVKKTPYVSPMYMYIRGKDHTFKLPNGVSIEQPKLCGRLSIKKGKNTTWLDNKGTCYLWGFANFQVMYNKNQQLFIAIEPTSDRMTQ
ncbi:hypothetical protein [Viridibacillus arvi]|uniref:hypothetical protein n=1 Tax=Viridibacillus arvi TaxID=263475 RepID=UPI0034D0187A